MNASLFFRLRVLVFVKVILEGKHVCDVVLRIVEEGLEVGMHALLLLVVLGVLLLPRAAPIAARLLLCLYVPPRWNATAGKAGHISPSCLHNGPHCLDGPVYVLKYSLWPMSAASLGMEYPPVDMRHLVRRCK